MTTQTIHTITAKTPNHTNLMCGETQLVYAKTPTELHHMLDKNLPTPPPQLKTIKQYIEWMYPPQTHNITKHKIELDDYTPTMMWATTTDHPRQLYDTEENTQLLHKFNRM